MIIIYIYIAIHNIFYISLKFLVIFIFVVIVLVRFCFNLIRINMYYSKKKQNHQTWLPFFYYVISIMYIYSSKKIDKLLTHFGDALYI